MLGRRRRRWANIKTTLGQCLVLLWYEYYNIIMIIIIRFLVKIKSVWTMSPRFHWFEADVYYYQIIVQVIYMFVFFCEKERVVHFIFYTRNYIRNVRLLGL